MNRKLAIVVAAIIIIAVALALVAWDAGFFNKVQEVALVNVTVSTTQAHVGEPVNITVTAKNEGNVAESFNVTAYYNSTIIGQQKVQQLTASSETNVTFTWNTAALKPANYLLKAVASQLPNEKNVTNNTYVYGIIQVRQPSSTQPVLFISPQTITSGLGQDFKVDVKIANVSDLYSCEIRLQWNSSVLDEVNSTEGLFLKNGGNTLFYPNVNASTGRMVVSCSLLGNAPGVSGNGTILTLAFHVKLAGTSVLSLQNSELLDSFVKSIIYTEQDGNFSA